jgi:hypothetical protein
MRRLAAALVLVVLETSATARAQEEDEPARKPLLLQQTEIAVERGEADRVEHLLAQGAPRDPHLLEIALRNRSDSVKRRRMVELLVKAGVPLAPVRGPVAPLEVAVSIGDGGLVALLVTHGAPVNEGRWRTPLLTALQWHLIGIAIYLLDHGAKPDVAAGEIVRALAASNQGCPSRELVRFLVARLHVDLRGEVGRYVLGCGIRSWRTDAVGYFTEMVALGADLRLLRADLRALYELEEQAKRHDPELASYLREMGATLSPAERARFATEIAAEKEQVRGEEARHTQAVEEEQRARARRHRWEFFANRKYRFLLLGAAFAYGGLAVGLREGVYRERPEDNWLWVGHVVTLAVSTSLIGAFAGSRLGLAYGGRPVSSSVFSAPGGDYWGMVLGSIVGGAAGLVTGILLRDSFKNNSYAYYAIPGVFFAIPVVSLPFDW